MAASRSFERVEFLNPEFISTAVINISQSGISLLCKNELALGSVVSVMIDTTPVSAKVIHVQSRLDGFRTGLQFVNSNKEQSAAVSRTVESFSKGVPIACSIDEKSGAKRA